MAKFLVNIREKAAKFKSTSLFRDSFWMLLTKAITMIAQVAYFIFVARYLGTENYGLFEGTKALWAIMFPFIGIGMGDILIQQTSRDSSRFSQSWGSTLLVFILSAVVALAAFFPLTIVLLPSASPIFIFLIFLADAVGLKLCMLSSQAFAAKHQIKQGAQYGMIYMVTKLIAAFFLPLFPEENRLLAWGFLYCIGSLLPGIILLYIVQTKLGKPKFNLKALQVSHIKQGFFFSLAESASVINGNIDRTMLVSMANPVAAGIYSAGYRFIDMGYIPIFAIQGASYPRFFKHGEAGLRGSLGFAKKLAPVIILYGLGTLGVLALFSPLVPKILGEEFSQSSAVLVWLAPIHLMYGLQYLASDSLTGAGFQRSRSFVQVGAAFLNIGLNLYLIPLYSWKGAIWATLASEVFKVIFLWLIILIFLRRQRH
jgi:O-antigen/teichoic acid export membrane protein